MKRLLLPFVALLGLGAIAPAQTPFQLIDQNSVVNGDASNGLLLDWIVDGVEQLYNEDYYYRIGLNPEVPVWTISAPVVTVFAPNIVQVGYQNNLIRFEILYSLFGGTPNSNTSDIAEIVRVTNLIAEPLDFHLFEYDDFDIAGTAGNDQANVVNSSTIQQWDGLTVAMVGSVPPFSHYEITNFAATLNKLNNNVADNLSDTTTGNQPGDLTFGMQWDTVIIERGSFLISKDKRVAPVPEPASFAILGLGLLGFLRRRK